MEIDGWTVVVGFLSAMKKKSDCDLASVQPIVLIDVFAAICLENRVNCPFYYHSYFLHFPILNVLFLKSTDSSNFTLKRNE